jgi:hypothetical protein
MLSFLKKIFGTKPAKPTSAPYKVEVDQFPFPKVEKPAKSPVAKKTAKKPAAPRKPRAKKSKE